MHSTEIFTKSDTCMGSWSTPPGVLAWPSKARPGEAKTGPGSGGFKDVLEMSSRRVCSTNICHALSSPKVWRKVPKVRHWLSSELLRGEVVETTKINYDKHRLGWILVIQNRSWISIWKPQALSWPHDCTWVDGFSSSRAVVLPHLMSPSWLSPEVPGAIENSEGLITGLFWWTRWQA